jgi:hypothetical protein
VKFFDGVGVAGLKGFFASDFSSHEDVAVVVV